MLTLLLAAAIAASPAPDRGAIGDPAAFIDACTPIYEGLPADVQKQMDAATEEERQEYLPIHHLTAAACNAILTSVVQTVMLGDPYKAGKGAKRVCINPEMTDAELFAKAKQFSRTHQREMAQLETLQTGTPEFLVIVLADLSRC